MGGIYVNDPAPRNAALELTGQPSLGSGLALGATAEESWIRSPFSPLRRQEQMEAAAGTEMPDTGPVDQPIPLLFGDQPTTPRANMLTPKEANERFGIEGELSFDGPTRAAEAQLLNRWKRDELKRQNILSRATPGILPGAARLGVGFLVQAVDPLNVASAFIPLIGEARFAYLSGRLGVTGARVARGATEGFVGAAVVEPLVYLQAQSEQADYDAYDSLLNLAFGTALGGGLHAGFGKLSDWIRGQPIELRETALRAAVAAIAEDRPVTVDGIMAFHGSPHEFDAFSLSKIGTGEGAQMFGHGLYFAENRGVAKNYADAVMDKAYFDDVNKRLSDLARVMSKDEIPGQYRKFRTEEGTKAAAEYDRLMQQKLTKTGNMYETRIRVNKDDLLDWDKPLSEQSPSVQEAYKRAVPPRTAAEKAQIEALAEELKDLYDDGVRLSDTQRGQELYAELVSRLRTPQAASEALRKAGIPGIKYLDQGSRKDGDGTRNFVMFDDSLIDIVSRNDQPTPSKVAEAQRSTYEATPEEAAQARAIDEMAEGWDQPITPEQGAEEAAELIEATNEMVAAAKKSGDLTDRDLETIKGDPEAEKLTKGRAAAYEAASACLARVA
jgi:hypothetical protein